MAMRIVRGSIDPRQCLADVVRHGYGDGGLSLYKEALMGLMTTGVTRADGEAENELLSRHLRSYCAELPYPEQVQVFTAGAIYSEAFGIHASWKYLPAAQQVSLFRKHIKI